MIAQNGSQSPTVCKRNFFSASRTTYRCPLSALTDKKVIGPYFKKFKFDTIFYFLLRIYDKESIVCGSLRSSSNLFPNPHFEGTLGIE